MDVLPRTHSAHMRPEGPGARREMIPSEAHLQAGASRRASDRPARRNASFRLWIERDSAALCIDPLAKADPAIRSPSQRDRWVGPQQVAHGVRELQPPI